MKNLRGSLFIVTGASGAGKTSIVARAIALGVGKRAISCTTRQLRANNGIREVNGVDYRFFKKNDFERRLANQEFAEYAEVYEGCFYGTLKRDIEHARRTSAIVYATVDIQGALTMMRRYPEARSIFIHVPKTELKKRLRDRGTSRESIAKRLAAYDREWALANQCHDIIANEDGKLPQVTRKFISLVRSYRREDERSRPPPQTQKVR